LIEKDGNIAKLQETPESLNYHGL